METSPSFEISWKQVEGKWDSDCFSKHKLTLLETRTQAMPKIVVEVVVEIRHITSGFVEHSRIFSPQFFETKAWNISAKLRICIAICALAKQKKILNKENVTFMIDCDESRKK